MEKIDVVLVALNPKKLETAVSFFDFEKVHVVAVMIDDHDGQYLTIDDNNQIPAVSFAFLKDSLDDWKDFYWLICGGWGDTYKVKKFLVSSGIANENILNFSLMNHITPEWVANIRYIEKNPIDFFSTGISYTEVGMDIECFAGYRGVNLACSNSDLRQNYLTAKYVFEHSPGKIKFVIIGLAPYSFRYDNSKAFSVYPRGLQFQWILKNSDNIPPPPAYEID